MVINKDATVEKLKDLGLRHGEKAGVAIASTVFFVCVGMAAVMPTIDTSPDQIKQATQQSESNLNRREDRETIVKKLEEKGITDSHFAKVVDDQVKTALVSDDYKPAREWVSTEPGAGLIRETPALIAATELYAYPGRGIARLRGSTTRENGSPMTVRTKQEIGPLGFGVGVGRVPAWGAVWAPGMAGGMRKRKRRRAGRISSEKPGKTSSAPKALRPSWPAAIQDIRRGSQGG